MNQQVNQFFYSFIQETINLKSLISDYNSTIINLSAGINTLPEDKIQKEIENRIAGLEQSQHAAFIQILNALRKTALSLQTDFNSIKKHLHLKENKIKEINDNYNEIKTQFQPNLTKCENYLQAMNDIKTNYINVESMIITQQKEDRMIDSMKTPQGVKLD